MYLFTNPDGANFIIASTWAQNPSVGISTKVDPKVGINQSEASIWVLRSTLTLMPKLGFWAQVFGTFQLVAGLIITEQGPKPQCWH